MPPGTKSRQRYPAWVRHQGPADASPRTKQEGSNEWPEGEPPCHEDRIPSSQPHGRLRLHNQPHRPQQQNSLMPSRRPGSVPPQEAAERGGAILKPAQRWNQHKRCRSNEEEPGGQRASHNEP
eukprot:4882068-Amphidinium_carterae.1